MKKFEHFAYISVFENNKQTGNNPPVYTGMVSMPDGSTLQVALWNKTSKSGVNYLGGSIQKEIVDGVSQPVAGAPAGVNVAVKAGPQTAYVANNNGVDGDLPF
jgi:hypothetical protein